MSRHRKWQLEWFLPASLLAIALISAGTLLFLKERHDRRAHMDATTEVLGIGESLLNVLCETELGVTTNITPQQWRSFSDRADGIFAVRKEVQSICVIRDGVEIFHRQADRLGEPPPPARFTPPPSSIEWNHGEIEINGMMQPVFIATQTRSLRDGTPLITEAALKRDAVGLKEEPALRLVSSLFAFSVGILLLSVFACAIVLIMAAARERKREERARNEEHLAFSGVLANGILHDFRNPMSAVRLDAQMLYREMRRADGFRPPRVENLAERISRTMERMDKIFHEFLYLAKPADEKPESVSLTDMIRECIDTLSPRLEQAGLTVSCTLPQSPLYAIAFVAPLKRALMNVLVNATQFAPHGSVLHIRLEKKEKTLQLEIEDEGPGIPPKERKRIFEMFTTGRPEGTGLGLFLAKTALERCGGSICVVDSPRGACFRIELKKGDNHENSDH